MAFVALVNPNKNKRPAIAALHESVQKLSSFHSKKDELEKKVEAS